MAPDFGRNGQQPRNAVILPIGQSAKQAIWRHPVVSDASRPAPAATWQNLSMTSSEPSQSAKLHSLSVWKLGAGDTATVARRDGGNGVKVVGVALPHKDSRQSRGWAISQPGWRDARCVVGRREVRARGVSPCCG